MIHWDRWGHLGLGYRPQPRSKGMTVELESAVGPQPGTRVKERKFAAIEKRRKRSLELQKAHAKWKRRIKKQNKRRQ